MRWPRSGRRSPRGCRRGRQISSYFVSAGAAAARTFGGRTGLGHGIGRLCCDQLRRSTGAASRCRLDGRGVRPAGFAVRGSRRRGLAARCIGLNRPAVEAEAQCLQHAAKLVRRAAEQRHHLRNDGEPAIAGRALWRRRAVGAAPRQQRPDQIGEALEHIEAHRARPAHVIAVGAIERLRAGRIGRERRQPGAWRLRQRVDGQPVGAARSSATTASARVPLPPASAAPGSRY